MSDQDDPLQLLAAICAIDSRTTAGAAGTTRVGELLAAPLRDLDFAVEFSEAAPEEQPRGRHLKAVRNPAAARRLILVGHTDTVLSPREAPFRRDDGAGRVYGSGVCDMKGGCVVLVAAVREALAKYPAVRELGLTVLLNCAEEFSGPSFPRLLQTAAPGAAACLCFEPASPGPDGQYRVAVGRKGVMRCRLTCHGRSAHAGNDHDRGVNAIRELARKIERIEALTDYSRELTANVGCIRGGHVPNQVADEAAADIDLRSFTPEGLAALLAAMRDICAESTVRSAADGVATRLELQEQLAYPPWPRGAAGDELAGRFARLAGARGIQVGATVRGGGSDASHLAVLMPALDGLGLPGGGMHTPDEWADIGIMPAWIGAAAELISDLA
ncbi:MAG: M20/M25/M40 family metallo-hydrolase [Kiritimatiellia bacterium]|nr:M20/M25/M40 family metallo-hydrolase [Lentisphaerota bacterium]